jgi:hypothetical protein
MFEISRTGGKGMNERIRELAVQAGDYVNETYTGPVRSKTPGKIWEDGHVDWHTQFNQKFAELLVKECASMARVFQSNEYDFTGDLDLDEFMLKHFGVEE